MNPATLTQPPASDTATHITRPLPIIAKCLGRQVGDDWQPCPIAFTAPDRHPRATCPECRVEVGAHDHQREAVHQFADRPGAFFDHTMGAGKSLTNIACLEVRQATRVLILCPKNVVDVWPDQLQQHSPRDWWTWAGTVQGARGPLKNPSITRRAAALIEANTSAIKLDRPFAAVVNYDACWHKDMAAVLLGTPWDTVILDESHRIKKPSGKASRLAARVTERTTGRGGQVLLGTGTPMPHSPLDVWAQMRALDGGRRLGTNYHHFCQRFGKPETIRIAGGNERVVYKDVDPDKLDEFTRLLVPVMHHVGDDVIKLQPPVDRYRTFDLGPAARRVYDQLERDLIADVGTGVVTAANAMVLVLRLAQVTSGYAKDADTDQEVLLDGAPDKARLLADVLEDVPTTEPVVVFCRFRADLDAVRHVAEQQGRRYAEISGRSRSAMDGPRLRDDVDLVAANIKASREGIDLTRARHGIYYSLGFELAEYQQSRRRLWRPGQNRHVVFTHLLAKDTVDHAIYGALRKRQEVITSLINHLKEHTP